MQPLPVDLIGFNPPFGMSGRMARRFINRAAEFQPAVIASILPFTDLPWTPDGYELAETFPAETGYTRNGKPVLIRGASFNIFVQVPVFPVRQSAAADLVRAGPQRHAVRPLPQALPVRAPL